MNVAFIKSKENGQNVYLTLKCIRGVHSDQCFRFSGDSFFMFIRFKHTSIGRDCAEGIIFGKCKFTFYTEILPTEYFFTPGRLKSQSL